jgi:uncharacterized protein
VNEPGSELASEAYERSSAASTSVLAYVEATSALTRMRNGGRLSDARHQSAIDDLDDLWTELDVHSVGDGVIERASRAAARHALRAYDSLHLATALALTEAKGYAFACWDRELRDAAREHDFVLVPAQI